MQAALASAYHFQPLGRDTMKRLHFVHLGLLRLAIMLLFSMSSIANAGEIYKWKDEKGNVHFGDKHLAPPSSEKLDMPASPPPPEPSAPVPRPSQTSGKKKVIAINNSEVPSNCKALIDAVTNSPPGVDRRPATKAFTDGCPGIAQECRDYNKRPQDNYCRWIRREGKDPIKTYTKTD